MPRSVGVSVENNFVNGLVTEATGLNFPENAVTETQNCIFNENGTVSRRKGIDLENGHTFINYKARGIAYVEYVWQSVAGNGDTSFFVQQIGSQVFIYRLGGDGIVSSDLIGQIDMNAHRYVEEPILEKVPLQFATGNGKLIVVGRYTIPIYVQHISGTTFTVTQIQILTRDFVGLSGDVTGRPVGVLTDLHRYNLRNQGWEDGRMQAFNVGTVIDFTQTPGMGAYPSNNDVWWLYKDAAENFKPILAQLIERGNSPAPKGAVILDEFYRDRSFASGIGGLPVESSGVERPTTVAFFAGRVFYSGVNKEGWNSRIYFSQIIQSEAEFGRCYQQNDPTSEVAADLLANDGGVIAIPEAGTIMRLWSLDGALIVFAANGVWHITGSQGIGFAANDYTVKKVSNIKTISGLPFVDVLGYPMWWTEDGINVFQSNSATGSTAVQTISDKKIKALLDRIPTQKKKFVKGAYNPGTKTVHWVYQEGDSVHDDDYAYNRVLCLNTVSGAFYTWTIDDTNAHIKGIACISGAGSTFEEALVLDSGGDIVVDASDDEVTVNVTTETEAIQATFKYTVCLDTTYDQTTYAEEYDLNFRDWFSTPTPVNFESYFISGYRLRGEGQRKFQVGYCTIFTDNELPSAYFFQGLWDFATSGNTGRWSSRQKVDYLPESYSYNRRRLKIRGHGIALQFKVQSVLNRPFDIIGWSVLESANASP